MLYHADISLLNSCNFSCGYCKSSAVRARQNNVEGIYDVTSPVIDADFLLDFIHNHLEGYIIQFTGGEPLTHPAIGYLLRETVKTNKVIVCTNGELIPKYRHLLGIENVLWRISYHPEYRPDKFEDVMEVVLASKVPYIVNYVCHPRHIESGKVFGYTETIGKYNNEVSEFEGVYRDRGFRLYDPVYDDIRTVASEKTFDLEMITVRPNGLVFTCHGKTEPVGDVYRNEFNDKKCHMGCMFNGYSICPTYNSVDRILKYYPTLFGEL